MSSGEKTSADGGGAKGSSTINSSTSKVLETGMFAVLRSCFAVRALFFLEFSELEKSDAYSE